MHANILLRSFKSGPIVARAAAALTLLAGLWAASALAATPAPDPALLKAIASPDRSAKFVARDASRHAAEELTFFGLKANMTVIEVWPGGGYWTEILLPYLQPGGHYIAALEKTNSKGEENKGTKAWMQRFNPAGAATPVQTTWLQKGMYDLAPADSVDLIVTFRNLHNWMNEGYAEDALAAFYKALKPGGILGIEDHRGRNDQTQDPKAESGYVREDYTIALAKKAGFKLVGKSELNANPKDTKDYPQGVWTLPPVLTEGDKDREKYLAIGEADNFVLKFQKPRH